MACVSSALIVGGGIAGMAAALALSKKGVECQVVELSDVHLGASLAISGRPAEALEELGVYDECYASGTAFTLERTATSLMDVDGRLISAGPKRPQWPGAKTAIGFYRPILIQILTEAAKRHGVKVRTGVTTKTVEDEGGHYRIELTDGETVKFELIVGADGIGSHTRASMFPGAAKPAYSGQMSIRWIAPGPAIVGEGWYVGPAGKIGFYHLPQGMIYVPSVIPLEVPRRFSKEETYAAFKHLLDLFNAPAVVELKQRLTPESDLICRPFDWLLIDGSWYRGRTVLIGDAAHATTAHMGMGGGMALEDAVVLAKCIGEAPTLEAALSDFMERRATRVRTVVETSVALSCLEQAKATPFRKRRAYEFGTEGTGGTLLEVSRYLVILADPKGV